MAERAFSTEEPVTLKTTLRLPAELMRRAKIHAVKTNATLQDIVEAALRTYLAPKVEALWNSEDQSEWREALALYWERVRPDQDRLEQFMNQLDPEWVESLNDEDWYNFLHDKYFCWKYTQPNRLVTTTSHLEKCNNQDGRAKLLRIKERLFAFDRENIQEGLEIAYEVRGLGWAGASGLLSVLFPKRFGTADQLIVRALAELQSLPKRRRISEIQPDSLTKKDAVLLIEVMRAKAQELNNTFGTDEWTPRKIDMILWALRG
jgi:hypothetical protein